MTNPLSKNQLPGQTPKCPYRELLTSNFILHPAHNSCTKRSTQPYSPFFCQTAPPQSPAMSSSVATGRSRATRNSQKSSANSCVSHVAQGPKLCKCYAREDGTECYGIPFGIDLLSKTACKRLTTAQKVRPTSRQQPAARFCSSHTLPPPHSPTTLRSP